MRPRTEVTWKAPKRMQERDPTVLEALKTDEVMMSLKSSNTLALRQRTCIAIAAPDIETAFKHGTYKTKFNREFIPEFMLCDQ